ncbi:MAG TPA: ABC transporter substrate-binding protein [Stellaceae bacterium]|jgi:ABC-type nitrate/sulfonate/bicarbonate transport system substrate-binding protein|nr:ABC transporter substrate-binding protein [Stellaceae bacterium]
MRKRWLTALAVGVALGAGPAWAQGTKVVFGVPGIPPIFASVLPHVAAEQGLFKKYGADVEVRDFETGVAAARAVAAGQIDLAIAPTPVLVSMVSNAKVNLVGIYGLPNPDWLIGSSDPQKTGCADLKGQPVGVDAVGGARSEALKEMLVPCKLAPDDVKQVALGSNTAPAMVAGQLTFGVLHLDDVPAIEGQLHRKLVVITTLKQVSPVSHYLTMVARTDKVQEKRDAYVKTLAALIEAGRFMRDPKNLDATAKIAAVTGHSEEENKTSITSYNELEQWPNGTDGLQRDKIDAVIATQIRLGGIKAGTAPVTYEQFVDESLWKDAMKLVGP